MAELGCGSEPPGRRGWWNTGGDPWQTSGEHCAAELSDMVLTSAFHTRVGIVTYLGKLDARGNQSCIPLEFHKLEKQVTELCISTSCIQIWLRIAITSLVV